MTTKKKIVITTAIVLVLTATGLVVASKMRKKSEADSGGSTTSNTISIPGQVYNGLTISQTRALQGKLNSFIQSGALGCVLGWLEGNAPTNYEFRTEASGKVYYRYMFEGKQRGWFLYQQGSPDIAKQAYAAWVAAGKPDAQGGGYPASSITNAISNAVVPTVAALSTFRNTIQSNLTNGSLAVDGVYGKNTMAVVKALQIYLNATKKSGLQIDGKYGKSTDAATGWHILT